MTSGADSKPFNRALGIGLPIVAGLALLYIPTGIDLAAVFWNNDQGAHTPLLLAMWAWLMWRKRAVFLESGPHRTAPVTGWILVSAAMAAYALGRSQEFFQFEVASLIPLLCGIVLILFGARQLRKIRFEIFFMLFLVPVPGTLLDTVLVPLKRLVSKWVAELLFWAGLPVVNDGVVLYAGKYQLLVADACSGLNSMIALSAMGLLYVYLSNYRDWRLSAVLLLAAIPVAFVVNLLRVTALVLLIYYLGDDVGQRFHDYAAYAEVFLAFAVFFLIDRLACVVFRVRKRPMADSRERA